ncbi:MAG: iron ABC transporter permease [bacterium]
MKSHLTCRRWAVTNLSLLALLALAAGLALCIGSEGVGLSEALTPGTKAHAIVFTSRLPRVALAALVGMALASSGGAFQALLRNPLADPFILGVSGGAALGAVASVGFGLSFGGQSAAAFLGAGASMLMIFWIARARGRLSPTTLLLTGVIFNAFCFALILFVNSIVTMEESYQILFLLIGNLEATGMRTALVLCAFVVAGFAILCACAWRMNLMSLGEDEAMSMGVNVGRLRMAVFAAASMMVGAAVAASGLIGFVGLFVPHIVRLAAGSDHRLLIPASGLAGAAFLILADAAARTILMHTGYATELPVGVVTALVGAPMFLLLLRRQQEGI